MRIPVLLENLYFSCGCSCINYITSSCFVGRNVRIQLSQVLPTAQKKDLPYHVHVTDIYIHTYNQDRSQAYHQYYFEVLCTFCCGELPSIDYLIQYQYSISITCYAELTVPAIIRPLIKRSQNLPWLCTSWITCTTEVAIYNIQAFAERQLSFHHPVYSLFRWSEVRQLSRKIIIRHILL